MTKKQFRSLFYYIDKHFKDKGDYHMTVWNERTTANATVTISFYGNAQIYAITYNHLTKKWEV